MTRLRWITTHVVWLATLFLVLSAFAFGPWLLSMGLFATSALCGMAAATITAVVIAMRHHRLSLPTWVERPGVWTSIVVVGATIRVAWGALLPVTLSSDPYDYYTLATQLISEGRYHSTVNLLRPDGQFTGLVAELLSWRPPGLPFLLAGWFLLFGAGSWAVISFNLAIYVLSALVLRAIALRLAGPASVAPVLLTFAVWPKHIGYTALPLTENVSLLLLMLNMLLVDISLTDSRRAKIYAGLTYGAAALVRPSLVLLPVVWAGMVWMNTRSLRYQILVAGTAVLIGLFVIAPWTVRNARVLGTPVLISTNGGDVLYRANNPLASGNWTPGDERDLNAFIQDEVHWNATGSAWAWEWIRSNPTAFLKLAIRKAGFLWGWEEEGILFPMHYPAVASASSGLAASVNILMNAWWFALLCTVAASLIHQRGILMQSSLALGLMTAILLFTVVHMVYESHARYHLPFTGALIVLACSGPYLDMPRRSKSDHLTAI